MKLPPCKTRIVCTIGPASATLPTLLAMLDAGMTVARLNFSHGAPDWHAGMITLLREASAASGRPLALMGDLPGPKMRIGTLTEEPVQLVRGEDCILTTEQVPGTARRVSVSLMELPQAVVAGDAIYLDDGFITLRVREIHGPEVVCRVEVGGALRSRKGLHVPNLRREDGSLAEADRRWLAFAASQGLDALSLSYVAGPEDIRQARQLCLELDYHPFLISKIERGAALEHLDDILQASDGIMVARGDLGVETPIEKIALVQKQLIARARQRGKPVITATQMLESMTQHRRPTRAEATDVANAILDGTDAVMLSAESAVGDHPVESVAMLAAIAQATEDKRADCPLFLDQLRQDCSENRTDLIALGVHTVLEKVPEALLVVPTQSGATARNIARFRHATWIQAVTLSPSTARCLLFSCGVLPHLLERMPEDWQDFARGLAERLLLQNCSLAVVTEGPSPQHPHTHHRLELIGLQG
ncbi:MAG: pyruvate kinase [Desulfobulbaceae bacterium A2]|nr:MAG: pyruvate kinase [Desulfobulbaceae bacterium A2]